MKRILITILISIVPYISYSQKYMSKEKIYSYYLKNEKKINYKGSFDTSVVKFVDNLKRTGIDTIGIYSIFSVGYITTDTCQCGLIPWAAYIEWIKNKKAYYRRVTKCCEGKIFEIDNSALIEYYINNKTIIDKEMIMPVITGVSKKSDGKIYFKEIATDHSIFYHIYIDLNRITKLISFENTDIENKNGLFYKENIDSKINSWKIMIENQIQKISN